MNTAHQHEEHKEKFQLERVAFFSDAVFAIAITLLIIEIKVPEYHGEHLSDHELLNHLLWLIPKFIGFVVSFFVIGLYWLAHHRLFRFVTHVSQKFIWSNLLFLFPIVVFPFTTSLLSEYYNPILRLPLAVYTINICCAGFFSYRLWSLVGNKKYKLSQHLDEPILKYNKARALVIPTIFIGALLLSFINPWISYFMLPFTPLTTKVIKAYFHKKFPELIKQHLE